MTYLLAHLTCRPGHRPEFMTAAKAMIAATRLEPECTLYDLSMSITDPQPMIFAEAWKRRHALAEHFETPHMAVWRKAPEGCFTGRRIEMIHPEKVEEL